MTCCICGALITIVSVIVTRIIILPNGPWNSLSTSSRTSVGITSGIRAPQNTGECITRRFFTIGTTATRRRDNRTPRGGGSGRQGTPTVPTVDAFLINADYEFAVLAMYEYAGIFEANLKFGKLLLYPPIVAFG